MLYEIVIILFDNEKAKITYFFSDFYTDVTCL